MKIDQKTQSQIAVLLQNSIPQLTQEEFNQLLEKDFAFSEVKLLLMNNYQLKQKDAEDLARTVEKMALDNDPKATTQMPVVGTVQAKPAKSTVPKKFGSWIAGAIAVVIAVLATALVMSKCGNGNGKNAAAAGMEIGKDDIAEIKSDLDEIKSAVIATDDKGNTAGVAAVAQDIRVNMVRQGDLSELAHKDDLSDLAKSSDLENLAKSSDLDGLATTKHLTRVERKLDAHRKATENGNDHQTEDVTPIKIVEDPVLEPARPNLPPGVLKVMVCKGGRKCKQVN